MKPGPECQVESSSIEGGPKFIGLIELIIEIRTWIEALFIIINKRKVSIHVL
jgi:hypothetical protein